MLLWLSLNGFSGSATEINKKGIFVVKIRTKLDYYIILLVSDLFIF